MEATTAQAAWLAQVQHDLVKRLLWPARDRRDLGGPVQPGELRGTLVDDEGTAITATALWHHLRGQAPTSIPAAALDGFATAIEAAVAAAAADDLPGVLRLETAMEALARIVKASR
jgi:hypothetical protein